MRINARLSGVAAPPGACRAYGTFKFHAHLNADCCSPAHQANHASGEPEMDAIAIHLQIPSA